MLNRTLTERLALRSERRGDCLVWTGTKGVNGYGRMTYERRNVMPHRMAWEDAHGPIPDGLQIDHICMNRLCIRVDHLRLATNKQNNEHRAGALSNNKLGIRGVSLDPRYGKYKAQVRHNGRTIWLGYHETVEAADAAAQAGRAKYFTHA